MRAFEYCANCREYLEFYETEAGELLCGHCGEELIENKNNTEYEE